MREKKFFYVFASFVIGISAAIASFNYCIDRLGVFRGENKEELETLNGRFVKMKYLLTNHNHDKYDSYLWGSSRIMKMDTFVTGQKTYNMGDSLEFPQDCLEQIKILLHQGVRIKTVYLGIDDYTYVTDRGSIMSELHRRDYKENLGENWKYYAEVLFSVDLVKTEIKDLTHPKASGKVLLTQNGTYYVPYNVEHLIEEDPDKHIRDGKFSKPTYLPFKGAEKFDQCLNSIKEIKILCDENGIQFVPFFNPQHMTTYLNDDMELMNRFKKELVKISPFWDFSGVNYVTSNNYFWYETSHPRAFICDKILDTVSGQNQMTWVPDFGVYVTEENVDAFCEKAVRDREAYDPNHEQWVPSAEERAVMTKRVNYPW